MATPQGVAHVEAALALVSRAGEQIERLEGLKEGWRGESAGQLSEASELLHRTLDRFYLKTKVCVPFARRCEESASALVEEAERATDGAVGREPRLTEAIEAVVKAARVLDERSMMQGMAIT